MKSKSTTTATAKPHDPTKPVYCTRRLDVDLDWANTGGSHGLKHDIELPQLRRLLAKLLDEPTVKAITITKRHITSSDTAARSPQK